MQELTPDEAIARLADASSLWRLTPLDVSEVIEAAVACLVADVDTPSLRELAGASPGESQFVLAPMIESTLAELGMQELLDADVDRAAVRVMLRRLLDGQIGPRDLARWAHFHIGHEGDPRCQIFVDFDDMYDTVEYHDYGPQDLDEWVCEEAQAFLAGRASPERTRAWREPLLILEDPGPWSRLKRRVGRRRR